MVEIEIKSNNWWKETGFDDVKAHTPNPSGYSTPDGEQSGKLRAGHKLAPGTVIPRSTHDGASSGFDAHVAGEVVVDPDAPGGGFSVDLTKCTKPLMQEVASLGVGHAFEAYSKLRDVLTPSTGSDPSEPKKASESKPEPQTNPHMPDAYTVPPASSTGEQYKGGFEYGGAKVQPRPPQQEQAMTEQHEAQNTSTNTDQEHINTQIVQALTSISDRLTQIEQADKQQQTPAQQSLQTVEQQKAQQAAQLKPLPDISNYTPQQAETPPAESQEALLESLEIDFLKDAKPKRPKMSAVFNFGDLGTFRAKYHAIVAGNGCVALIFDTRYEDGVQWVPPNTGVSNISVYCPELEKTFTAASLGLELAFGALDIIVLPLVTEERESEKPGVFQHASPVTSPDDAADVDDMPTDEEISLAGGNVLG